MHAFVVHSPAFPSYPCVQPSIAKAGSLGRQTAESTAQLGVIRPRFPLLAHRGTVTPDQPAGTPLCDAELRLQMARRCPVCRRRYPLFASTSFNI
jgi:hypothetical protein